MAVFMLLVRASKAQSLAPLVCVCVFVFGVCPAPCAASRSVNQKTQTRTDKVQATVLKGPLSPDEG